MTKLELITAVNQAAIVMRMPVSVLPTHLRCPSCAFEFVFLSAPHLDRRIVCANCRVISELRQMHEAWCARRRDTLGRAFPELR